MFGLFFDTETTGKAAFSAPSVDPIQPKLVQLGAILTDLNTRQDVASVDVIVYPESWDIPQEAALVHGITTAKAKACGIQLDSAVFTFRDLLDRADICVAHNIKFDKIIIDRASAMVDMAYDREVQEPFAGKQMLCTMLKATPVVKKKSKRPAHNEDYAWPKLVDCSKFFWDREIENAHSAIVDVKVCRDVFFELVDRGAVVLPQ